jgi:hypothetical protein
MAILYELIRSLPRKGYILKKGYSNHKCVSMNSRFYWRTFAFSEPDIRDFLVLNEKWRYVMNGVLGRTYIVTF